MDPRPIRRRRRRRAGAAAQAPRAGAAPSSDPRAVRLGCWPPCSAQKVTPTARAPQGRLPGSVLTDRWTISLDHLFLTVARTRQRAGRRAQARVAGRPRALRAPPPDRQHGLAFFSHGHAAVAHMCADVVVDDDVVCHTGEWRFSHMVMHTCVRMSRFRCGVVSLGVFFFESCFVSTRARRRHGHTRARAPRRAETLSESVSLSQRKAKKVAHSRRRDVKNRCRC